MFDKNEFAANLRSARARLDISLDDLAARTGISVNTLMSYESGDGYTPKADKIAALCHALHVSPDWLFSWKEVA